MGVVNQGLGYCPNDYTHFEGIQYAGVDREERALGGRKIPENDGLLVVKFPS